jgi:MOB kinase activator 1
MASVNPPPANRVSTARSSLPDPAQIQLLINTQFLRQAAKKPPGVNLNHWLSTHTVDFFQLTTMLYGTLLGVCTDNTCVAMNCGQTFEYLWRDGGQRPVRLSAPEYVARLTSWIDEQINDEAKFPTSGPDYPDDFHVHVKNIFRRLFRVYAHAYTSHYDDIARMGMHKSFNTAFMHFLAFAQEFDLISVMELKPAKDLLMVMAPEMAQEKLENSNAAQET